MGNCCSSEAATATIPTQPTGGRKGTDQAPAAAVAAVEAHTGQELPTEASQNETGENGERAKTPAHGSDATLNGAATPENGGNGTPMSSISTPSPLPKIHTPRRIIDGENGEVEAPGDTHTVRIGNYNLRYSYYSKRGYYPEARKKANQDSYYCETHFAGDDQKAFFAVFDGHGQYGDVCAQYAADQLPANLAKRLQDNVGILPALTRAHVETNQTMHEADFDDSMSGTTAISVLFCGDEIHISNVGDSRAIIAQEDLKAPETDSYRLIAKPLSIDQTPFRKDERERVKKCGARILTVDQVEGLEPIHENWGLTLGEEIDETGDPPRIWHPYGQYPGTAFTRSIGDLVSEELGVVAEPEILCKGLNVHDRFIVIASDGVFEFLTSQNVVDIVQKFDDPSDACQALVEEAYNRWLQFEVRTDDITAICIFLDGITQGRDVARGSIYVGREVLDLQSMQRPVRGAGRKDYGPRNTIVGTEAIRLSLTEGILESELDSVNLLAPSEPAKSDEEVKWIKDIVQGNFLFNHLSEEKVLEVISVLKKIEVKAGEIVIHQGSPGDTFYLVDNGEFEVRQLPEEAEGTVPPAETDASPETYGDVIHVYKSGQHLHPTFGELALIYSKPRAATVIAKENGALWALDRLAFRSILMRGRPMRDVVQRLRQISLLRPLTVAQTNLVAEEMKTVSYAPEQVIVHEGNNEQGFFLITSGRVEAFSRSDPTGSAHLKAFDYFGEVSLVRRRSISQRTLRAVERTECLFINKETLELAVGKLSSILEKDKIRRSRKDRISVARKSASENAFIFFDDEDTPFAIPTSIDDIEIVGSIFSNVTNTIRLVSVKGAEPPVYMTLRTVSKQAIYDASMQKHVCGERDIYVSLYEKNILVPHVCCMNANDTDIHYLYDTQVVGDLDTFLEGEIHGESFVRYYAAQVVLALEFLHAEGIVCRTVDPTNLLVDRNGNIRMLNLRLSKYVGRGRTYTVCGTPEYLSPEQIKGEGHNIAADYWALGVLMYELLCGHTPFSPERKDDIEILNHIASFNPDNIKWPDSTSAELRDIVSRLLCPELTNRLGYRDVKANFAHNTCDAIKNHPFFAGTSWEAMKAGSFAAPLEAAAAAEFRDICAHQGDQAVNIGSKYSGDFEWLSGF